MLALRQSFIESFVILGVVFSVAAPCAAQVASPTPSVPIRLTLQNALELARRNSITYLGAAADAEIAREDKKQAVAALLPSVSYNNSAIYTDSNGVNNAVKFIANNAVHEYMSQGNVHETLDVAGIADAQRASAAAAAARARAEIASRGLVVAVVQSYYVVEAAQLKLSAAQRAADDGESFLKLTGDLERGGEVAHSDVIKAHLQANDRRRQLQEAALNLLNARLDLSVLLSASINESFDLVDDLHASRALPDVSEIQSLTSHGNPDVQAALQELRVSGQRVAAARAGYLPSLSFDYFYGIDATHFATRADGIPNLGTSIVATVNIPIWNWGATQSKVKQAELRRDQTRRELSLVQRRLLAEMQSMYAEARAASDELTSLQQSVELSAESLRLVTLRYKNGESTVLEVVDAQNTATLSDAAYQDGAVRYRVALANLQTLTGVIL